MSIAEGKKRVVLTFPVDALNAFKADARRLNMSLSSYAFLVLAASSYNYESAIADDAADRFSELQNDVWKKENPERWAEIVERAEKKKKRSR